MHQIVANQKAFFQKNVTKNISYRIKQLKKLEFALKENEQFLHEAIFQDFKKSEFEN